MGTIAIITGPRTQLDQPLKDDAADIFLLCGNQGSAAQRVYDFMRTQEWDDWQHVFLARTPTAKEKNAWFGGSASERYVVLRGVEPKKIARQGPVSDLLDPATAQPHAMRIDAAFTAPIP